VGNYEPKGTQCAEKVYKNEYKCSSITEKGAAVMVVEGYPGCTGSTVYCSSSTANLYWSKPLVYEQCSGNALCVESFSISSPGKCATDCKPGYQCCDADGNFEPLGTQCGEVVYEEYYKCNSTEFGDQILIQKGYRGCKGESTICSFQLKHMHWSKWEGYQKCKLGEICKASIYKTSPGKCVPK
jgi:hypothetical protein